MKKHIIIIVSLAMTLSLFVSCKQNSTDEVQQRFLIKGSESEKFLTQYIVGSYNVKNKLRAFDVEGGGSESGIEALKKHECDIANSSRVLSNDELLQYGDSVKQAIIAVDAIAVITHPTIGIGSLTVQEIAAIYSGKIRNWKEVGGPDLDIMPIGRKEGSGTRVYWQDRLAIDNFSDYVQEFGKYEDIVAQVEKNKNAIGYVSLKAITNYEGIPYKNVWIMPISLDETSLDKTYLPYDKEAIFYGDYPLIRPLFQYYIGGKNNEVEKFIQFEISSEGQELVKKLGFYPINDFHKQINKLRM
jgi:phosphate transport system substrate-binding protein